jgi:hypothetical protein
MNRAIIASLAAACALLACPGASAATQGELGASSTGSIAISLSVAKRVQIGGLNDVTFAAVSPDAEARAAQSVCVWSNTATRGYSVMASGDGAGQGFALSNGAASTPYSVAWHSAAGQASGTQLSSGTALTGLTSDAPSPDCAAGAAATSSLIVTVAVADLQQAQPESHYAGTLNLLVSPE